MSKAAYHLLNRKRDVAQRARVRVVLFGFAGGSITALLSLARSLPDWVEVWGAEYPGRGLRWKDAPVHKIQQLTDDLVPGLQALCDRPTVLLGYSMGANVAYRLALRLAGQVSAFVCVSATPPCRLVTAVRVHEGSDQQLLDHLIALGGIPSEILANEAIMEAFLPVVRADLACCADMAQLPTAPLDCPILVLHGAEDRIVEAGDGRRWLQVGAPGDRANLHKVYAGGHFFHHGVEGAIAADIADWIASLLEAGASVSNQVLPVREAHHSINHV